ncbi:uncharacterized protein [Lolium perenne]|uniref:uncharacterized protein n=1 Tax=Lolium perenne TaxID=4522 RepID=UPI003A9925FC
MGVSIGTASGDALSFTSSSVLLACRKEEGHVLNVIGLDPRVMREKHFKKDPFAELTKKLLEWNNDLTTQRDENGSTPLHFAAALVQQSYRGSVCSLILEANPAALYQSDNKGLFPIHVAASVGERGTIIMFLKKSTSSAGLQDTMGRTFLHIAAENNKVRIVSFVCRNQSLSWILNMQDYAGNTVDVLQIGAQETPVQKIRLSHQRLSEQIVQLTCDMVGGTSVRIPICIDSIGGNVCFLFIIGVIIFILPTVPAILGLVSLAVANLASDVYPRSGATAPSTTTPATTRRCATTTTAIRGRTIITAIRTPVVTVITAVTALTAVTTISALIWTAATLALRGIGRCLEVRIRGPAEHVLALVISINLGVEVSQRDRRSEDTEGGHQGVVGATKARKDKGNMFPGRDGTTGHSQFIDKALHLGQGSPQIRDLGFTLRGEHLFKGLPDAGGMLDPMHVGKNLVGERLEEVAEDDLILGDPGVVRRVRLHLGSLVDGVLVRRDLDLLRWGGNTIQAGSLLMFCALLGNRQIHLNISNKKGQTALDISRYKIPPGLFDDQNSETRIHYALKVVHARSGNCRRGHFEENYNHQLKHTQREELKNMKESTQTLCIGAVLIATVTFGATFALPGGYRDDEHTNGGTPTLAGRYAFDAFILASTLSFILSAMSIVGLKYSGYSILNPHSRRIYFLVALYFASMSITCFMVAFALGLYMVLAPVAHKSAITIGVISPLVILCNKTEFWIKWALLARPLCTRIGLIRTLVLVTTRILFNTLMEFWPIIFIFVWAAYTRNQF